MRTADSQINCPPIIVAPAKRPGRWVWLLAPGLISGLLVYYFVNPSEYSLFPSCQFYRLTGILCPGCGGQRAVHHLLHGEIAAAFRANALLLSLLIPMGIWLGLRWTLQRLAGWSMPALFLNRTGLWLLIAALVVFGILRNLPGFAWLRP